MNVQLHLGDCLEVLAGLPENSVDTCITDPPYELGFMGKKWDSSGIAFQPETWQAVFRVLKPGAMLLAFGGTRTYHRMVCAIEDAGFEIRDTIAWVYGSGFPKSYDISKGIDKQAGATGEVIGKEMVDIGMQSGNMHAGRKSVIVERDITAPSTPEAQLWHGWGTALKPAFEPIVVAMKPIDGTYVNNALTWGVAGLWIDGGRVRTDEELGRICTPQSPTSYSLHDKREWVDNSAGKGRFPANFIHDGSDEVLAAFPQSNNGHAPKLGKGNPFGGDNDTPREEYYFTDSGSAARFFYCAKASRSERNAGLEGMEAQEVRPLGISNWEGQTNGSGKTMGKSSPSQNHHPTVKPIALMRYLVRLTKTPTGGVVLDPFMGSGTTGIACELEGRDFIGIEREAEYVEIAEKRIADAQLQPRLPLEVQE